MEVLCALGFVLLIVMLIGHGMWVAVAFVFRSLGATIGPVEVGQPCPHCGARFGVKRGQCVVCGNLPRTAVIKSTREDELRTTSRQLKSLREQGAITQQQCDDLVGVITAELEKLAPRPKEPIPSLRQPAPISAVTSTAAATQPEIVDAVLVEPPPVAAQIPAPTANAASPASKLHPLDRPYAPPPPAPPRQPGRSLADMLQSFMEESNIRWGEILAATLIVLCSTGLVISLRNTLKDIPYFPAILFTLFTVAFHGAGLYTLRRWKLQAVSRVILTISLLLVPLTFCGAIVMQQTRPVTDPLFLIALAAGVSIFSWVCYSASRELVGEAAWPLSIGVLGPSLAQVLIQRLDFDVGGTWLLQLGALVPVASFLVATGWQLGRARNWRRLSQQRVIQLLRVLGVAIFAILPPLVLLLVHTGNFQTTMARLSPQLSLAAAAGLAIGLMIHRRTTAKHLAAWQTAGTAILVLAAVLLILLVVAAWPEPELLLVLAIMNGVILAVLGVIAELPLLHIPAVACAALAASIGWHLTSGHFADRSDLSLKVVQAAVRGQTAVVLSLLGAAVAGLAGWLSRKKLAEEARMLLIGVVGLAVGSLLIALFSGFIKVAGWPQDRDLSAAVLLVYAVACIAAGPASKREQVAGVGSALLWLALVQALAFNETVRLALAGATMLIERPVLAATLIHASITSLLSVFAARDQVLFSSAEFDTARSMPRRLLVADPLAITAALSLVAAAPFILWVRDSHFSANAVMAAIAAIAWAILTLSQRWRWAVSGLQIMLALAAALVIAGHFQAASGGTWVFQSKHLFAQISAIALGTAIWSIARRLTSGLEVPRQLLQAPWPAVDQVLVAVVTIALPILAIVVAAPHVGWELGFVAEDALQPIAEQTTSLAGTTFGWIALAALIIALTISLCERIRFEPLVGLGIASFAAVWLGSLHFQSASAAASAARWAAAVYAVGWATLYLSRQPIHLAAKRLSALRWQHFPSEARGWFAAQPLVFGGATILILTILAVQQHLSGARLQGPLADTFFANIGATASYVMPLAAIVGVFLAYAVREHQAAYALGGAAVAQLAVNLAYLLHVSSTQTPDLRAIQWLQWNSVAAAGYALLWLALSRWITPPTASDRDKRLADGLWFILPSLSGITAAILVVWAAVAIAQSPAVTLPALLPLGSWMGYAAVGLTLAAIVWRSRGRLQATGLGDAAIWLAAGIVPLIGASLSRLDTGGLWFAYHTLEVGWLFVSSTACALTCWPLLSKHQHATGLAPHHLSVAAIAGLSVALAVGGNKLDPAQPWWSVIAVLAAFAIASALGLARRSQPYAFVSTLLAGLATFLFWSAPAMWPFFVFAFETAATVWSVTISSIFIALVTAAGFWLWREILSQQRLDQSFDPRPFVPRVHALVAGTIVIYALYHAATAMFGPWTRHAPAANIASFVTAAAFAGLLTGMFWDRRGTQTVKLAYAWGCLALLLAIEVATPWMPQWLEPRWPYNFRSHLVLFLTAAAFQVAISGHLWSYGANLAVLGARWKVPDPVAGLARTATWLPTLNISLATLVCVVCCLFVLGEPDPQLPFRILAAILPAIVAWGLVCLAQDQRAGTMQLAALLVAGLSAIYLGWAQLEPGHTPALWLTRVFRLLMVLAALTFIYGLALPRFLFTTGSWNATTRQAGYIAAALSLMTFVATLVLEVALYIPGVGAPVEGIQVAAIAVVLTALIAGLISLALLPGRDPLVLSEQGRQGYVYAAEITAALLFAHLYVCRPYWFNDILRPYWPFIVMGLAFLGVGAAELFQSYRIRVLAEPLNRTSALLPLLPVLGLWAGIHAESSYSLVLLVAGILYLALSYTNKSWAAMCAAVVAGNAALWSLLHDVDWTFAANPQLWLIPPALSVLIAAQLNRRRLQPELLTSIRYIATSVIYVSSTSEIFIRGFGAGIAPPMILLGLAVAGALIGIALRVRAFLMLGSIFTLLALMAMVRHAAQSIDHVWPWWLFGITLGVAILVLFGVFEKRRTEVTLLIARLRQWEQ